jgi:hypothetical protein
MQPMRRFSMHSWMIQFFPFWGGGRDTSSQSVPKCIPRDVPNSAWVLSNMVCSKFNSLVYKLKRWNPRVHIYFYFATGGPKKCFYGWHAQCSKKITNMRNQYGSFKNKNCEGMHVLNNMNHTMSPSITLFVNSISFNYIILPCLCFSGKLRV